MSTAWVQNRTLPFSHLFRPCTLENRGRKLSSSKGEWEVRGLARFYTGLGRRKNFNSLSWDWMQQDQLLNIERSSFGLLTCFSKVVSEKLLKKVYCVAIAQHRTFYVKQRRSQTGTAPSFLPTKTTNLLLHWLGWEHRLSCLRASFSLAHAGGLFHPVWSTLPAWLRQANGVVNLSFS